jgi:hypothetical protein
MSRSPKYSFPLKMSEKKIVRGFHLHMHSTCPTHLSLLDLIALVNGAHYEFRSNTMFCPLLARPNILSILFSNTCNLCEISRSHAGEYRLDFTLMMEAISISEASDNFFQAMFCDVPNYSHLHCQYMILRLCERKFYSHTKQHRVLSFYFYVSKLGTGRRNIMN